MYTVCFNGVKILWIRQHSQKFFWEILCCLSNRCVTAWPFVKNFFTTFCLLPYSQQFCSMKILHYMYIQSSMPLAHVHRGKSFDSSPASCSVMVSVTPLTEQLTCTPSTSVALTCRVEMKLLMLSFTKTNVNPPWVLLLPTESKPVTNVAPMGGANTPGLLVVHLTAVPVPAQIQNSVVLGHSSAVAFGLQVILVAITEYWYIDTAIKTCSIIVTMFCTLPAPICQLTKTEEGYQMKHAKWWYMYWPDVHIKSVITNSRSAQLQYSDHQ